MSIRPAHIIALLVSFVLLSCGPQRRAAVRDDSAARKESADSLLNEYLNTLVTESAGIQKENIDYILTTGLADTSTVEDIAWRIYDFYRSSPLMGVEAMAVYVTDEWLSSGKIPVKDRSRLSEAMMYASFNRNSLVGMKAPHIVLQTPEYGSVSIPEDCAGRRTVLYFYDDGCAVCRLESSRLRYLTYDYTEYGLDIIAVYTGQDEDLWKAYRESRLPASTANIRIINVWDPGFSSDFPLLYGVTSTPKIFLLDEEGTIVGRNLDTPALTQLLNKLDSGQVSVTPQEMSALVDILVSSVSNPKCSDIRQIADEFDAQLSSVSPMARISMLSALYYDLRSREGYIFKCGADYMAEKYILPSDLADASTKADAELFRMLFAKAPLGSKAADFPLPGRNSMLSSINSEYTVLYIYSGSCKRCGPETAEIDSIEREYGDSVTVVRIDCDTYDAGTYIAGFYDISVLPSIFLLGKDKTVYAKYLSAGALRSLLESVIGN